METITIFSTGLAIAFILSLIITIYLNKALTQILVDVCGTEPRARFWVRITNVSIILTAMLMALSYNPRDELIPLYQLSRQLSKTLAGLLLAVLVLSITITRFVRRLESQSENIPR